MYLRMAGMVTSQIAMDSHTHMSIFWQDQRVHNLIIQLPNFFSLSAAMLKKTKIAYFHATQN